jgi:hypothetical protein
MLTIKEREIPVVREMGLDGVEMFEIFDVCFEIPKPLKNPVLNNVRKYDNFWLIDTNFEFILKFARGFKFLVRKGINRIVLNEGHLRGGNLIPITIRMYGTELILMIPPNTSAIQIYNIVATWMGQEPNRIRISICRNGPKYIEGMGHVLTSTDHVWNGVYHFDLFEAEVSRKKSDMPNHGLTINENVDVVIDLKSVVLHYNMSRFLKLTTVKRILKHRWLKDY